MLLLTTISFLHMYLRREFIFEISYQGLIYSFWRDKPMPLNSVSIVGSWTDGPTRMHGFLFGPDLQMEKD